MKYLHKYILFLLPIFFLLISNADAQSIIHLQNWEGQAGAGGWFGFETTDNNFARGTDASGVFQGNKAIYISDDESTYGYNETVADEAYLQKNVDFPSSATYNIELSFTWKCVGEVGYDYMKVYLVDRSLGNPTESAIAAHSGTVIPLNSGNEFSGQSTFTTYNETLPTSIEGRTDLQLVFTWTNDNNTTNGVPAAIDNIILSLGPVPSSLSGDYLVGSDASAFFPTLTDATYFLNSFGVSGDTRFLLTDETYDANEAFPIQIDNFNNNPPSPSSNSFSLTIEPQTGVTPIIEGALSGNTLYDGAYKGLLTLSRADNVTLESLEVINNNTAQPIGVFIASASGSFNENINISNCTIEVANAASGSSIGLLAIQESFTSNNGGFDNISIDNNTFRNGDYGIYFDGGSAGSLNGSRVSITNNNMNQAGADALDNMGIYVEAIDDLLISGNNIGNFDGTDNERDYGIYVASAVRNSLIEKNEIHDLSYTGSAGYTGIGIRITSAGTNASLEVSNNLIYQIDGDGDDISSFPLYNPTGILLTGTQSGIDIYNNSIYLDGNTVNRTNAISSCIYIAANSSADIRNNNLVNNLGLTASTGRGSYGIVLSTNASQLEAENYNNIYVNATGNGTNRIGRVGSTDYATLSNWKGLSTNNSSDISADPGFSSITNLQPDESNPNSWYVNGTGVQISTVTDDFTGSSRSTTLANGAPDIGAYEINPSATPNDAVVTGSHTLGGTETFTVGNRTIARITWGGSGTLPTLNYMKYYSGNNPPNIYPASAKYMNCYFDISALGGSGYSYEIEFLYDEALSGTVAAESDLRLAKNDGSGWNTYSSVSPVVSSNSISVSGLSSFSSFTGTDVNNPLPVELLYFDAIKENDYVLLEWETASEKDNDYFQIERSEDGITFDTIGKVSGAGNSKVNTSYSFKDVETLEAKTYYRLKQVDFDGDFEYSPVVSVGGQNMNNKLELYPNPANDFINLRSSIVNQDLKNIQLTLYTVDGQLINENNYSFELLNNEIYISINTLSKGIYLLEAKSNDFTEIIRFIKQ
ncbi:hypothetical protein GCM10027429_31480 [Marivirga atlantica]|jgi:hypothetical protein|uniref:T9SS type A sorting domain-containing protein n=1 Tax=Marivirga atlantica TaxID=1548457 RepID=A0A937AHV9_9BACT|nr:T9SS type A sorting domain-containing protein [Marivirga atlantica]MBL0766724.1 T9SS type A sorting domain-containing protein [Marivirga atlantica]